MSGPCVRCGCPRETHRHYHAGTYCGRCGLAGCPRYRRPRPWRKRRVAA